MQTLVEAMETVVKPGRAAAAWGHAALPKSQGFAIAFGAKNMLFTCACSLKNMRLI